MCLLRRNTWFIALLQACVVAFALVVAWLLRFDFAMPHRALLFVALPFLLVIRLAAIRSFDLLHGWWRYTGVNDILDVCKAVAIGSTAFFAVMNVILGVTTFPRSIYVLEAILTAGFLAAMRLLSRVLADSVRHDLCSSRKIVIVGAGFAAQMILREIRHYRADYLVVGCVDDDSSKLKLKIQGVPVMGKIDDLPTMASQNGRY
ncbi:MAG: nucleoside-diphosphate sugar epimerase/dehydratase [Candidatus Acidiferrales bacterium]